MFFDVLDVVYTWESDPSEVPRVSRGFESPPIRHPAALRRIGCLIALNQPVVQQPAALVAA